MALPCGTALEMRHSNHNRRVDLRDMISPHAERLELVHAERGCERHVGGVAAAGHQDSSNAGDIVSGVERMPGSTQVHLKPGAEIHRRGGRRHADIPQVTRAVPRRNVQAAAEGERQVERCHPFRWRFAGLAFFGPLLPNAREQCGWHSTSMTDNFSCGTEVLLQ